MLDVVEAQGFRKVACATTAPMHFQLLESDVLLELLELLLVELCRAALTLSSNSCLRQFARAFPRCRLRWYCTSFHSKAVALVAAGGPWPWNAGACLRGACAELARGLRENTARFSEKGRQAVAFT